MIRRFLDRLFGKRHRDGWPRGVRPVAPWAEQIKRDDPELWAVVRDMSPAEAAPILRMRGYL